MIPDANFTLAAAKEHLRVTWSEDDALITAFLDAAVAAVERITRKAWTERDWSVVVGPCEIDGCDSWVFHAEKSPATAEVFAVNAGVDTPLPATDWFTSTKFGHTVVRIKQWSVPTPTEGDVGRIDWHSDEPDSVPPEIYAAVMLYLGDLYENREAQHAGIAVMPNATADVLLRSHVIELHV